MDNNNLLTVKEVAEITGLSRQNIYQQMSTHLKNYVIEIGNKKKLSSLVLTEYYKIDLTKIENNIQAMSSDDFKKSKLVSSKKCKVFKVKSSYSSENNTIIEYLKTEIQLKNEQITQKNSIIADKDNRINELTDKITELTDKLTVLLENSQQLQQNQQLLQAKFNSDSVQGENIKKVPLLIRIFKKK